MTFQKKSLVLALAAAGALGLSSVALANGGGFGAAPVAPADTGAGFVIGAQGGYADTHWDNTLNFFNLINTIGADGDDVSSDVKDSGFAARLYLGYNVNHNFGIEAGYVFLPNAKVTLTDNTSGDSQTIKIKNYAIDLVAKLMVPVSDGFGLYAKAGGAYFHSTYDPNSGTFTNLDGVTQSSYDTASHFGPAYGVGAFYEFNQNIGIDLSWMHYSGNNQQFDSNGNLNTDYQPNPDLALLGIYYKFPV